MTLLVPIKDLSDLRQLAPGQRVRDKDGDVWAYDPAPRWTLERHSELVVSHESLLEHFGPLIWLREMPAEPAPLAEGEAYTAWLDERQIRHSHPVLEAFGAGFRAGQRA